MKFSVLLYAFFYKNKFYKNTQAKIYPKFKNKLRTTTRLNFDQKNLRNLFNSCTRIEMNRKQNLTGFSLRVIGKLVSSRFADAVY